MLKDVFDSRFTDLFVFDYLSGELGLRDNMVADKGIALHGADAMADRMKQFDLEEKGVARHYFLAEFHLVNAHEIG